MTSNRKNKTNAGLFWLNAPVMSLNEISNISWSGLLHKLTGGFVLYSAFNLA